MNNCNQSTIMNGSSESEEMSVDPCNTIDHNIDPQHESEPSTEETNKVSELDLKEKILITIAHSLASFKCQHKDEPELSLNEKKKIANDCLTKSHAEFLSRFGKYLNVDLLKYFSNSEDFAVRHYMNKLTRYFDNNSRQMDKKNRRYEALKVLVEKGEYFSETEMMRRNPLLYENLVGKYLTKEEKDERDRIDTTNISFVNLLMESIERDGVKKLKKNQEEAEDATVTEEDSDSDCDNNVDIVEKNVKPVASSSSSQWGEISQPAGAYEAEHRDKHKISVPENITIIEQNVLKQEFITLMYRNFLDGNDNNFDYSEVDNNEAYDNLELRSQDEEEKYFDSESPELAASPTKPLEDESEDELDQYMKALKDHTHDEHHTESPV